MNRLYLAVGLFAAFDLSTELGYLALAVVVVHLVHHGMKKHKGE